MCACALSREYGSCCGNLSFLSFLSVLVFGAGYYCGVLASVGFGALEDLKSSKPVKMISSLGCFCPRSTEP